MIRPENVEGPSRLAFFCFFNPSMFRTTLELARALRDERGYEALLFCPVYLPQTERYRDQCDAAGLCFASGMTPQFRPNPVVDDLAHRYPHFAARKLAERHSMAVARFNALGDAVALSPDRLSAPEALEARAGPARLDAAGRADYEARFREDAAYWGNLYIHLLRDAYALLYAVDAKLLVCAEENVDYNTAVFVDAIHRLGRPSAVFSSALPTAMEGAAYFFDREEHHLPDGAFGRYFRAAFAHWIHEFEGRTLTRFPVARAVAMEVAGLAPRLPWIINTGASDILAAESEFARELFVDVGAESFPGRVRVLGHPALDDLFRATHDAERIRAGLRERLRADARAPIALFSVPTDQFSTTPAPGFASYEALLDHWVQAMDMLSGFACAVSAHPMLQRSHLERLRAQGALVLEEPASALLPACDLYVASMSTTIKWARAMGKPVINYDCYRMRYEARDRKSYLDGYDHIQVVRDPRAFLALLGHASADGELDRMAAGAMAGREYWGRVDGRSLRRVVEAFDELAQRGDRRASIA